MAAQTGTSPPHIRALRPRGAHRAPAPSLHEKCQTSLPVSISLQVSKNTAANAWESILSLCTLHWLAPRSPLQALPESGFRQAQTPSCPYNPPSSAGLPQRSPPQSEAPDNTAPHTQWQSWKMFWAAVPASENTACPALFYACPRPASTRALKILPSQKWTPLSAGSYNFHPSQSAWRRAGHPARPFPSQAYPPSPPPSRPPKRSAAATEKTAPLSQSLREAPPQFFYRFLHLCCIPS